jgi:hypothetical protein
MLVGLKREVYNLIGGEGILDPAGVAKHTLYSQNSIS